MIYIYLVVLSPDLWQSPDGAVCCRFAEIWVLWAKIRGAWREYDFLGIDAIERTVVVKEGLSYFPVISSIEFGRRCSVKLSSVTSTDSG